MNIYRVNPAKKTRTRLESNCSPHTESIQRLTATLGQSRRSRAAKLIRAAGGLRFAPSVCRTASGNDFKTPRRPPAALRKTSIFARIRTTFARIRHQSGSDSSTLSRKEAISRRLGSHRQNDAIAGVHPPGRAVAIVRRGGPGVLEQNLKQTGQAGAFT